MTAIICICEYNAVFGDVHPICIPYDQYFSRTKRHPSNLYFGASIAALRSLASKKGYRFVGTNLTGNDAFFVREDYAVRFVDCSLRSIRSHPSLFRESRDPLSPEDSPETIDYRRIQLSQARLLRTIRGHKRDIETLELEATRTHDSARPPRQQRSLLCLDANHVG